MSAYGLREALQVAVRAEIEMEKFGGEDRYDACVDAWVQVESELSEIEYIHRSAEDE